VQLEVLSARSDIWVSAPGKGGVKRMSWVSYKTHLELVPNLQIRGREDLGIYALR
jgi:hypothetical protein